MNTRQLDLFDSQRSESGKARGMAQAAESRASLLSFARRIAIEIALGRESRECNADDVQRELVVRGISPHALGNTAGSLFRYRRSPWEWTGRRVKSARVCAHANELKIWKYVGNESHLQKAEANQLVREHERPNLPRTR